jgi:nucleoside-diphosphate-sugar epimerase
MKIVVTGGAGFIGSHLCERLISDEHSVTTIDDLTTGSISNLANLEGNKDFNLTVENRFSQLPLSSPFGLAWFWKKSLKGFRRSKGDGFLPGD